MNGKLIVIEGIDSSGKTTQLELLKNYFQEMEIPFKVTDFPRYDSFYGEMIGKFLRGEFGPLDEVNPYVISVIYANDRREAREEMQQWLDDGYIILSNRYATSNMAHQVGRVSMKERESFVNWLEEMEYKIHGIPKEDIVLLMDVPYQTAQKLMGNANREQTYRQGEKKDIVEKDSVYLEHAQERYLWLADNFKHWIKVQCVDEHLKMLPREEIHEEIKKILAKKKIIM